MFFVNHGLKIICVKIEILFLREYNQNKAIKTMLLVKQLRIIK